MHAAFIRRCIELAENGRGRVQTNPLVGCVIVKGGAVVTEGWHEKFGGPHAEVHAIKKAGDLAHDATLYVNLEPCCSEGKQPPCTDAIVRSGIKTVVFGARDTSNRGSEVLRSRGLEVVGPILESECRRQNKGFFSLIEKGRPWVTIKKAIRTDGSINGKITNEEQDAWSHSRLRATHNAILVGSGTVTADNPQLNIRHGLPPTTYHLPPRRVVLDPHNQIPKDATVLNDKDANRTLVINEKLAIPDLLERLENEGIASILVEGGPSVWRSFEESGLYDEVITLTGL